MNPSYGIQALRLAPVLIGFIFSLYYSRLLGIENRSFLTFVLLTNTLLSFLFLSGLGFRIRNTVSIDEGKALVLAFILMSIAISLLVAVITPLTLIISSDYLSFLGSGSIPTNALMVIAIYAFMSALSVPIFDLLSTLQTLRTFLVIELLVVVTQLLVFSLLTTLNQTSYFVSVLIAFSLSYAFLFFSTLVVLISNGHFTLELGQSFRSLINRKLFANYLRSSVSNLIERLDKILIPFFYSSPQLAQVSIFSGILSFFRIIPDTNVRVKQNRIINGVHANNSLNTFGRKGLFYISLLAVIANLVVYFVLGQDWLLPLPLIVLLTVYEFFVWKAKELLTIGDKDSNRELVRSALLGFFYLLPLPFLMMNLSYAIVLMCTVITIFVWLKFSSQQTSYAETKC